MTLSPEILSIAGRLQKAVNEYGYADINIGIKMHDNRISLVTQMIVEKIKPAELIGVQNETNTNR